MQRFVLMIDDDRLPMEYYIRALEQNGYKVHYCLEPDSALAFVEKRAAQIILIILDIMLPPGEKYKNEDTRQGLCTGVLLLKELTARCKKVPIIVLTNVTNPDTLNKIRERADIRVVSKKECPPFEFCQIVKEVTNGL